MSSTLRGDRFEAKVARWLTEAVRCGQFLVPTGYSKVFTKKAYYSQDRKSDIVTDVSIETTLPGQTHYSLLVLVECKNYQSRVPVDDVEELHDKMRQVGANKGILFTASPVQSSTREFAKSRRITIYQATGRGQFRLELPRRVPNSSPAGLRGFEHFAKTTPFGGAGPASAPIGEEDADLVSLLREAGEDLLSSARRDGVDLGELRPACGPCALNVPYATVGSIEETTAALLKEMGYRGGEVDLDALTGIAARRDGLVLNQHAESVESTRPLLGKIAFDPLEIHLWADPDGNNGRARFTHAHELGHYFLGHGAYFRSEHTILSNDQPELDQFATPEARTRLEVQANLFAAAVLMPAMYLATDFFAIMRELRLVRATRCRLFVDWQPANQLYYRSLTSALTAKYGVSPSALDIRLQSLGLLVDRREQPCRAAVGRTQALRANPDARWRAG